MDLATSPPSPAGLAFGPFVLDPAAGRLRRGDGTPVELPPRDFAVLCFLAARAGRLVGKDELLDGVWGHRFVTESALKSVISRLRAALGDDPRQPAYIETAPRRGYRFVARPAAPGADAPAPAPSAPVAAPPLPAGAGNVPPALPPLHGRIGDIAALCRQLEAQRWVTLTGPGGMGKTRLAQAVAQQLRGQFRDGVWLVELAALADGAALPGTIAHALGLNAKAAQAAPDALGRALATLELLLVLDNAEQIADAVAPLAANLLAQAPRLRLLVTSQTPVRGTGETLYRLQGLPVPAPRAAHERRRMARIETPASTAGVGGTNAVSLFVERVQALLPGWSPAEADLPAVHDLCRRLDGIPLALELAAARVPLLGVAGVHERLDHRLRLLTRGARSAPARQQTLENALQWTFDLLDPPRQAVWRRLGVFAGSFTLEAAQQVAGDASIDDWAVLDALDALVDHALLQPLPGATPQLPQRYRLLESPRAFALGRLQAAGEDAAVRERHARALLATLQRTSTLWLDMPTIEWQLLVLPDLGNLRAAFAFARADPARGALALALAAWGVSLWLAGEATREAVAAIDAVAPHLDDPALDAVSRARYWHALGLLGTAMLVPAERGFAAAGRALEAWRALGDATGMYWALSYRISTAQWADPQFDKAAALAQMRALEEPDWPPLRGRPLRFALALDEMYANRWPACRDRFRQEYELTRRLGDLRTAWIAGGNLAHALLVLDQTAEALAVAREVVAQARAHGRLRPAWGALNMQGLAAIRLGRLDEAEAAMRELLALQTVDGSLAWTIDHWPGLLRLRGDHDNAARLVGLADAVVARGKAPRQVLPQLLHDRDVAALREQLGADVFDRRTAEGASWQEDDLRRIVLGLKPA
ncbi:MAG: helix-turn-helix transcriptional regulator [Piscinibacter sp.]|nr:helix-turn-helix transcriptional regulator [Piscinibacter sp.]